MGGGSGALISSARGGGEDSKDADVAVVYWPQTLGWDQGFRLRKNLVRERWAQDGDPRVLDNLPRELGLWNRAGV